MFKLYILKRQLEDIIIFPFIIIGRIISFFHSRKTGYETYFFFSFYHTGGAEKVHALITKAIGNPSCIIYFTRKSDNENFYNEFKQSGCKIKDISKYTDSKTLYFINLIWRGIISGYINRQNELPVVFNGQCNFGYKISPWINTKIPQVELIHSLNTFSWIRIPFVPFITKTIMISKVKIEEHLQQYKKLKVPDLYHQRIRYILNGIHFTGHEIQKDYSGIIKVLYVGRGTEEKRVHLIAELAQRIHQLQLPAEFVFIGDVHHSIPPAFLPYCILTGNKAGNETDKIYDESHIVIITSYTEGFPLAIMEGMSKACAIIATPVGDIPIHVKNNENGFLFTSVNNKEKIINEGIKFVTLLTKNRELLKHMGERNKQYAVNHFGIEKFNHQYQQLIQQLRSQV